MDQQEQQAATPVGLDLPAHPRAAAQARRALRDALASTRLEHRYDDAALALSELVTNAILHGREPLSLVLRLAEGVLRVEVRDGSPLSPAFSMLDAGAVTGRGLLLVASLSDRWGLTNHAGGKAVWFELDERAVAAEALSVDELLASWGEDVADPGQEVVKVVLTELDVELTAQSEAHVEALLRELALVATCEDRTADLELIAEGVLQAAVDVEALRAEVKRQVARAVVQGTKQIDVVLRIARIDAETVRAFARAVDDADRASRRGLLLLEPAPSSLSQARNHYLQRIVNQLSV